MLLVIAKKCVPVSMLVQNESPSAIKQLSDSWLQKRAIAQFRAFPSLRRIVSAATCWSTRQILQLAHIYPGENHFMRWWM